MRYYFTVSLLAFLLAAVCPTAIGQAAAEYGLGAGRAATTTAPARNVANGIAGVFDSLSKAAGADAASAGAAGSAAPSPEARRTSAHKTKSGTQPKPATKPVETSAANTDVAPSAPSRTIYEDPRQIQAGIGYDELVRRFGPAVDVGHNGTRHTHWYSRGETSYQVELKDKKVVAAPGTQLALPPQ